jgi:hypothetical protein
MDDILKAIQFHNWYAVAALALTLLIQAHRKFPWLGAELWARIPDGLRFLVPLIGGAATGFVQAYLAGKGLSDALGEALRAALGIGGLSMGYAAALRESPIPWDGSSGGRPKQKGPTRAPYSTTVLMAFCLALACSPSAWQEQRQVSNVIAQASSEVVLPAIERAYTVAGERAVASSESLLESRARLGVIQEQWRPIFEAYEAFRLAHAAWQVAIETEGDTLATADAVRVAFCNLRTVAAERVKLPDFPIPGAGCG